MLGIAFAIGICLVSGYIIKVELSRSDEPTESAEKTVAFILQFALLSILLFGVGYCAMKPEKQESPEKAESRKEWRVYTGCRNATLKRLHDPDSTVFDEKDKAAIAKGDNEQYNVIIGFRAKNGFGAMRRGSVHCDVDFSGAEPSLNSINIVEQIE